jgi:hypothetical protein
MQIYIMKIISNYAWDPEPLAVPVYSPRYCDPFIASNHCSAMFLQIHVEVTVLPLPVDGNIITVCLLPRVIYSNPAFPGMPITYWEAAKRGVAKTETEDTTLKQANYASNLYTVHSTTILSRFHYRSKLKFL